MRNIGLLLAVVLPLFLIVTGVLARVTGCNPEGDVIGTAAVLFPGLVGPVLTGGVMYLALLHVAVARVPGRERLLALALTPLLALGFVVFGVRHVLTIPHFLAAFALAVIAFGLVVRIPSAADRKDDA